MSRRGFRGEVQDPRPPSAWAMVSVASATLWITQQLDLWAMAVQIAAILVSLARRTEPFAWQRSGIALNVGMLGIVAGTVVVAMRGEPSTVALAHFAALTQGLQLLDARPRRTEFLLVALALFQVVLASNLTDSVFFPPLLVAFLFATVWTLLVHTLRSEAEEAGQARELPRAITPGLLRTTIVASGLSVLLALVLFVVLPRMRSSVVTASRLNPTLATAGFSDTVEFGELGRIRQDPTVVLRVETLAGEPPRANEAYWRGLAFDTFDGTSWSIVPAQRQLVPGSAEAGVDLGSGDLAANLVQRVVREPVSAGVLFRVGRIRGLQGTIRELNRDHSGGLYARGQEGERVRYTVRTRNEGWRDTSLRADRATSPRTSADYLQLPELSDRVRALAHEIAAPHDTDADRARALERHLLTAGRYSDTPPTPDPEAPDSPIETFLLGGMAGHCEYFATAMVLMARELALPARLVNGFAGGRENRIGGFVELSRSDAHAWVEIHYERAGWVRYDPTPPDLRLRPEEALSLSGRLRELGSAMELWWFQRVVGFDRSDQMSALKTAWLAWKRSRGGRNEGTAPARETGRDRAPLSQGGPWREALVLGACAATGLGVAWGLFRRRRREAGLPRAYARGLRVLARRGLQRRPATTARAFALEVQRVAPPPAAEAFATLTEAYLSERFGGHRPGDLEGALLQLRKSLPRGRLQPREVESARS